MTKKPYPKTHHVSRAARSPRHPSSAYPFERRYAALQGDDEHPIDQIIDRIPKIAELDGKVVDLSRRWSDEVRDAEAYREYEDLRVAQRALREEAFFDAGHREGLLAGAVESLDASVTLDPESRLFARQLQVARIGSKLSGDHSIAVLLEMARAMLLWPRRKVVTTRRSK